MKQIISRLAVVAYVLGSVLIMIGVVIYSWGVLMAYSMPLWIACVLYPAAIVVVILVTRGVRWVENVLFEAEDEEEYGDLIDQGLDCSGKHRCTDYKTACRKCVQDFREWQNICLKKETK
jgi:hypothetical protein